MEKKAEEPAAVPEEEEKKKQWHLPGWVREAAIRITWVVVLALIPASIKLYWNVVELNKDVARNTWWNQEQDRHRERTEDRVSRLEGRQDRSEEADAEFHSEMREKTDRVLKIIGGKR